MSSVGILFPGQGAQAVGMGRWLCDHHNSARAYFDRASEVLGYDLSSLCFDGPEADSMKLSLANPHYLLLGSQKRKPSETQPERIEGSPLPRV